MTVKLYLYKLLSNEATIVETDGVASSDMWNLMAFDRTKWRSQKLRAIVSKYKLKPFEVNQNDFDLMINYSKEMKIKILDIEFVDKLSDQETDDFNTIIQKALVEKLIDFIQLQRYENQNDIMNLTFRFDNISQYHLINFSSDAVLTLERVDENLNDILSTQPIGVLAGKYMPFESSINGGG